MLIIGFHPQVAIFTAAAAAPTTAASTTAPALTPGGNTACSSWGSRTTLVYVLSGTASSLSDALVPMLLPSQCGQTCMPDVAFRAL
jgi:hypothetical protein